MGRAGFEPAKPKQRSYSPSHLTALVSPLPYKNEPPEGFEPTTPRLQITCSGQLSYTGDFAGAKLQLFSKPTKDFFCFLDFRGINYKLAPA